MIRTSLFALMTISFCYFLDKPFQIGGNTLPGPGSFMSPFHGFWQNAESIDKENILIDDLDLSSPVEVVYDKRLVPHVFGEELSDVLKVQGYLHAKHRLWQMDMATRAAAGKLSEVLGKKYLDYDKNQRRIGMLMAAENAIKGWQRFPKDYQLLLKYVDGVNAYISSLHPKDYPLEFKLLGYAPEEWTALHSALFMKNMASTLCSGHADIENTNMLSHFGQEEFDYLFPEYNPKQSPIIPRNVKWSFENDQTSNNSKEVLKDIGLIIGSRKSKLEKGIGSNNWAVDGTKTKSGNPILCGDPHLQLTLPSIWYEIQINCNELNAYGVSLPGIPGVIIGFNENIAWSETNVGHDVWDYYQIEWIDDNRTRYRMDGEEKEVTYRIEEFNVKGGQIVLDTVKLTELGIVIEDRPSEEYNGLAFDWLPHKVPNKPELRTFLDINKASNYNEFSKALENYISPAQNFAFASKNGDIALTVNGDFPIKKDQAGRFISSGASSQGNWTGFIPRDQIPKIYNPERGFISSANQYSTGPDYPYYYNGNGYFEQYRGRILNDKLSAMSNIESKDMMALQYNVESYKAKEAIPLLLSHLKREGLDSLAQHYISTLEQWDYTYEADSKSAPIFDEWWRKFYEDTFDEFYVLEDQMDVQFPENWVLLRMLEEDSESAYFDIANTPSTIENATDIVNISFGKALKSLQEKKSELKWHEYRQKHINHMLRIDAFSHKNLIAKGHGDALNAFGTTHGPSWRMIVSLDDKVKAKVVYPGGQSGNPGSPYYDDMIDNWVNGKYYDAHFVENEEDLNVESLYVESYN